MKNKLAQTILEYAVVIICVVAALIAMQIYIKRAKEGNLKQAADSVGEQYAPKRTTGVSTLTHYSKTKEKAKTMSEYDRYVQSGNTTHYDFNLNGVPDEKDVFATEVSSKLRESNDTENSTENLGEFGPSLFED